MNTTTPNPGGTGLEQSPSDCGDGRGDNGLTPGGAGGGRAPGNPIRTAVALEMLAALHAARANSSEMHANVCSQIDRAIAAAEDRS